MEKKRLETKVIQPEGPWTSKVAFFGEAPGEEEDEAGRPFIGSAGQLLNRCFSSKGFIRDEVIVGNIFWQRPPSNKILYYYMDKKFFRKPTWEGEEHIELTRKFLLRLRERSSVNLLVALGACPTKVLTGQEGINKWRGSIVPCTLVEGFKVYCTYHPSHVQRLINEESDAKAYGEKKKKQQNVLPVFLRDLERIKTQMEFPEFEPPERKIYIDLTLDEYLYSIKSMNDVDLVAVDIETLPSPYGPILWCIGFSSSPEKAVVLPIIRNKRFAWSTSEEARLWKEISALFLNPNVRKVFQGGTYDLSVLGRFYSLRVANRTYEDTMWCHHASYPYIRKGLASLASIYTWEPYYKDDGKVHFTSRSTDQAEFAYNGKDCTVTREILPILERDARELGTYSGYRRTRSVIPSILGMMLRGVKIDLDLKAKLNRDFKTQANFHSAEVNRLSNGNYNLNSSDQKRRLLYGYMGLEIQYQSKTGKATVDKGALKKLRRKYPHQEILTHLLEYQKFSKLSTTYADMELDPLDQRMRTSYQFVSTWRTNSSGSPFIFNLEKKKQAGGNLQQIPKRTIEGKMVRRLFVADPGMIMLSADLEKAEGRFVAWDSEDLELIELYQTPGLNVYWEEAKKLFGIDASVPFNKKAKCFNIITGEEDTIEFYYYMMKKTVHASNYDMGPFEFQNQLAAEDIHLDFSVCKRLLSTYKAGKIMLSDWKRKIRDQIKTNRTLITPLGRKREFMGRLNDTLYKAAYAFKPQSTVGELLTTGIQEIWETTSSYQILMNVHDEVVGQCLPKDIPEAWKIIKQALEKTILVNGRELKIPCEFSVGPNWGQLVEVTSPEEAMATALKCVKI